MFHIGWILIPLNIYIGCQFFLTIYNCYIST